MCQEAYRDMASRKFKGVYQLESKKEQDQRNKEYSESTCGELNATYGRGPVAETFSLTPTDAGGNNNNIFEPKVVASGDGDALTYIFTAEFNMGENTYRRMALDRFKKVCWIESNEEQDRRDREEHEKRKLENSNIIVLAQG